MSLNYDKVIRTCTETEALHLHQLNSTGNYFYNFHSEGTAEFHYIIVEHKNYRLEYLITTKNYVKGKLFTGNAVELYSENLPFL